MKRPLLLLSLIAASGLTVSSIVAAQEQPPGQLAAEPTAGFAIRDGRVQSYLAAFSSGDPARYRAWLEANRTPESLAGGMDAHLTQYEEDFARWGELSVNVLRLGQGGAIEAMVTAARTSERLVFVFDFNPAAPYLVSAIHIRIGGPPERQVTIPDNWTTLEELAQSVQQESGIPAIAIGVYRGGKSTTAIAGVRKVGEPAKAELSDEFAWGSVTKSVTGTVLGALVQQGRLNWDSTIGEILPDVAMNPAFRDVALWQLMAHQAGVAAITQLTPAFDAEVAKLPGSSPEEKRAAFVDSLLERVPDYPPGTSSAYSNGGPVVAARMAEVASGKSWEELVRELVFKPAGMTRSGFGLPVTAEHPDGIYGHIEQSPGAYDAVPAGQGEPPVPVIAPAGGVRSSIGDFLRYGVMHLDGLEGKPGPLSPAIIAALHTPQPGQPKSFGEDYTFGWGSTCPFETGTPLRCQGHNGSNGIYYAQLLVLPKKDIVIAFMANGMPGAEAVSRELFAAIYRRVEMGGTIQ